MDYIKLQSFGYEYECFFIKSLFILSGGQKTFIISVYNYTFTCRHRWSGYNFEDHMFKISTAFTFSKRNSYQLISRSASDSVTVYYCSFELILGFFLFKKLWIQVWRVKSLCQNSWRIYIKNFMINYIIISNYLWYMPRVGTNSVQVRKMFFTWIVQ